MKEPIANLALSNAVRPGVVGWLKTLARELGPDGITVNTIAPGRIDTERLRALYGADGPPPEALALIPARRIGIAGRDRRDRLLPRVGAGRLRQRRGRAGRRRHAERAVLACPANARRCSSGALQPWLRRSSGWRWFVPVQRLPLRPEHGHPRRRQGEGRGREAARRRAGRDLLRRRLDPAGDLGRAAAAVPPAGRCHARAAGRGRAARFVVRGHGTRTASARWPAPRRSRPPSPSGRPATRSLRRRAARSSRRSRPTRRLQPSSTRVT